MKWKRILILTIGILITLVAVVSFSVALHVKASVKELFKLNKKLQEEGYYMAEFEFMMLGFSNNLDKGHYLKGYRMMSEYHARLKNRKGLIKIPDFKNNHEEIDFYLNLQNPKTGAFMDESAPFCTYWSCTENILLHLEALNDSTTLPLKLKYPLMFLDEINTPEKVEAYLKEISYVGWLAPKFPQTTFHFARDVFNLTSEENILTRKKLYTFSPEWKQAVLKWMYEFQDSTTGFWGPKDRKTKKLVKLDLNNTASILKHFRTKDGDDIYKEFPLKYHNKLFKSTLGQLYEPIPDNEDLGDVHEWNLKQSKGINMLLRYLWKDASAENKKKTKSHIADYIKICFEKYYVEKEGAFSFYPNAEHASIDGSSVLIFLDLGAYSYNKQIKLWGEPAKNIRDKGISKLKEIKKANFDAIANSPNINSLRIYIHKPDFEKLTDSVWAVVYPKPTQVLDIMELVPNIIHWAKSSSLSIGNWVSMEELKNEYQALNIKKPLIFKDSLPIEEINRKFKEFDTLYIIGFDVLQIPCFKIEYIYE